MAGAAALRPAPSGDGHSHQKAGGEDAGYQRHGPERGGGILQELLRGSLRRVRHVLPGFDGEGRSGGTAGRSAPAGGGDRGSAGDADVKGYI